MLSSDIDLCPALIVSSRVQEVVRATINKNNRYHPPQYLAKSHKQPAFAGRVLIFALLEMSWALSVLVRIQPLLHWRYRDEKQPAAAKKL